MAKNSSFYSASAQSVRVSEVKPSYVHDVSWQFSVGMHWFRFLERETLRVRRGATSRRVVKGGVNSSSVEKCEQISAVRGGTGSGSAEAPKGKVRSAGRKPSRKGKDMSHNPLVEVQGYPSTKKNRRGEAPKVVNAGRPGGKRGRCKSSTEAAELAPLPLSNPKRSAAGRRERIKSRVRSVSEKGKARDSSIHGLKQKNPVRVGNVPSSDTWHHREMNDRTGKWIFCTDHYCVGPCKEDTATYPRCSVTKTPLNRCKSQTTMRQKYLRKKKVYIRKGANRKEKRRNWFNDKIWRPSTSGKLIGGLSKSMLSKEKHLWMQSPQRLPPAHLKSRLEEAALRMKEGLPKSRRVVKLFYGSNLFLGPSTNNSRKMVRAYSLGTPHSRKYKPLVANRC